MIYPYSRYHYQFGIPHDYKFATKDGGAYHHHSIINDMTLGSSPMILLEAPQEYYRYNLDLTTDSKAIYIYKASPGNCVSGPMSAGFIKTLWRNNRWGKGFYIKSIFRIIDHVISFSGVYVITSTGSMVFDSLMAVTPLMSPRYAPSRAIGLVWPFSATHHKCYICNKGIINRPQLICDKCDI